MTEIKKFCRACQNTGICIGLGMFKGPCDLCAEEEAKNATIKEANVDNEVNGLESIEETRSAPETVETTPKRKYAKKSKTDNSVALDEEVEDLLPKEDENTFEILENNDTVQ